MSERFKGGDSVVFIMLGAIQVLGFYIGFFICHISAV